MKRVLSFLKNELMLVIAALAAVVSFFLTPPSGALFRELDWETLGKLFMMLCVLEGFKKENIFRPLILLGGRFKSMWTLSAFLIFSVFFSSMFVTNDVSLIIFVPLTILLFRGGNKEHYILPVISMENIAAIRGSMLMPFGSPQNLFMYSRSGVSAGRFILHTAPLCVSSGILLLIFITVLYRKDEKETITLLKEKLTGEWTKEGRIKRVSYLALFVLVLWAILSRTELLPYVVVVVALGVLVVDRSIFKKVDYVLLLTFFCFFVFSANIAANASIAEFLKSAVSGHEYWWAIGLSQVISNVPATIVLYPFTTNLSGLLYGADTAGLCSLIGSLASVINYRIYVREYPGNGKKFIKVFTLISWAFFIIVVIPGWLLSRWAL